MLNLQSFVLFELWTNKIVGMQQINDSLIRNLGPKQKYQQNN